MSTIDHKKFFYPPGGILIWIIILIEVITFCAGIIAFLWQRSLTLDLFEEAKSTVNINIGLTNTLLLLISGYFVAESVRILKFGNSWKSLKSMWMAMIFGIGFLILKGLEYWVKLEQGFDLTYNTFYTYYWLLTGFHFLHVLVGLIILSVLSFKIKRGDYNENKFYDIEPGAAFWHMCDIIWLLLFPIIYLL